MLVSRLEIMAQWVSQNTTLYYGVGVTG